MLDCVCVRVADCFVMGVVAGLSMTECLRVFSIV